MWCMMTPCYCDTGSSPSRERGETEDVTAQCAHAEAKLAWGECASRVSRRKQEVIKCHVGIWLTLEHFQITQNVFTTEMPSVPFCVL